MRVRVGRCTDLRKCQLPNIPPLAACPTGKRGHPQDTHLSFRMRQHGVYSCRTSTHSSAPRLLPRDWKGPGRFDVCWTEGPRMTPTGSFGPLRVPRPWHACWHAWRRIQRVNMYVAVPLYFVKLGWYRSRLLDCWNALTLLLLSWQCPPSHTTVPTPCVSTPCSCGRHQPWSTSCTLWGCLRIRRGTSRLPLCAAS